MNRKGTERDRKGTGSGKEGNRKLTGRKQEVDRKETEGDRKGTGRGQEGN